MNLKYDDDDCRDYAGTVGSEYAGVACLLIHVSTQDATEPGAAAVTPALAPARNMLNFST